MFKIRRTTLSSDRHLLSLAGRLTPGWAGGLTRGLAESGVIIERGFASRNARGFWTAELELRRARGSLDPERIDFDLLLSAPPLRGVLAPICLDRYTASRAPGDRHAILEVEAPEQVGFLAQLFGQLAFYSLFPVEMRFETLRGVVRDLVYLASVAGGTPSDHVLTALRRDLDRLVVDSKPASRSETSSAPTPLPESRASFLRDR